MTISKRKRTLTINHFLFGEVEEIFEDFLTDFESGTAKEVYRETRKPDITKNATHHATI